MANKLELKINSKEFSRKYVKDFNLSIGCGVNSQDAEYGVTSPNGSITLYDIGDEIEEAIKNKNIGAKNELGIESDYICYDSRGSQYIATDSKYNNAEKMLSFGVDYKNFGSQLDKIEYEGYQLKPYSITPFGLFEHIIQRFFPNYIPNNFGAWEFYGTKNLNIWNMGGLTVNNDRLICHAPRGFCYGVKLAQGIRRSVQFELNSTPSRFTYLRIVARKGIHNEDGTIDIDLTDSGIVKQYDLVAGVKSYSFYDANGADFLVIEAQDEGVTRNRPHSLADTTSANYTDLDIRNITSADTERYDSRVHDVPLGDIPYPRLDKSSIRTALKKVCCALQCTVGDGSLTPILYSSRSSDDGTNKWGTEYYPAIKVKKPYIIKDIEEEVLLNNDYDSVDMRFDVVNETSESFLVEIDTSKSESSDDLTVSFAYIGSASSNKQRYAYIKKKITTNNKFIYSASDMSCSFGYGKGYLPYYSDTTQNKFDTITSWGGTKYFWGMLGSSWFFSEVQGYLETIQYPDIFISAVEPLDENTCYLLLAVPVERSSALTNSYMLDSITATITIKTVAYTERQTKKLSNPLALDKNELICTDTLAKQLVNNILYDYKYGIANAEIKLFGTLANSIKIDDIYSFDGNTDENGILKTWRAKEHTYSYDGAIVESIKLQQFVCYKTLPMDGVSIIETSRSGYYDYTVPFVNKWLENYRDYTLIVSLGGVQSAIYRTQISDGTKTATFEMPDGSSKTSTVTCTKNSDGSIKVVVTGENIHNYPLYVYSKDLLS